MLFAVALATASTSLVSCSSDEPVASNPAHSVISPDVNTESIAVTASLPAGIKSRTAEGQFLGDGKEISHFVWALYDASQAKWSIRERRIAHSDRAVSRSNFRRCQVCDTSCSLVLTARNIISTLYRMILYAHVGRYMIPRATMRISSCISQMSSLHQILTAR